MWYEICINDDLYEVCYDTQDIIKITCEIVALGINPDDIKIKEHSRVER